MRLDVAPKSEHGLIRVAETNPGKPRRGAAGRQGGYSRPKLLPWRQHPPKTPPAGHRCRNADTWLSYAPHPLFDSRPRPVTAPLAVFIRRPRQFSAPALVFAAFISPRDPSAAKLLAKLPRGFRDKRPPIHVIAAQRRTSQGAVQRCSHSQSPGRQPDRNNHVQGSIPA